MPAQQWILSRGADGEIQSSIINNLRGINNSYKLTSFERGESMVLEFNASLTNGQIIEKGYSLGRIYSSNLQENLVQLNGELSVLNASLKASMSGVKESEIKEAQERLEMAKSEYVKQTRIVERLNKQLQKEVIAEEVFQTASDELKILGKAVNVRQAELESSISGEKTDEINMLKTQIIATEKNISFLQKQIDSQNSIIAPFRGRIEKSFSEDTLLVLSNFDVAVAFIPVALEEASYIEKDEKVSFSSVNQSEFLKGVVQRKQTVAQILGGKQCIMVLATVYNVSKDFISGVITQAEINCGSVSLQTYLKRNINN